MGKKIGILNRQTPPQLGDQASVATVNQVNLAIEGKWAVPSFFDAFEAIEAGLEIGDAWGKKATINGKVTLMPILMVITPPIFELAIKKQLVKKIQDAVDIQLPKQVERGNIELSEGKAELKDADDKIATLETERTAKESDIISVKEQLKTARKELEEAEANGDKVAILKFSAAVEKYTAEYRELWEAFEAITRSLQSARRTREAIIVQNEKAAEFLNDSKDNETKGNEQVEKLKAEIEKLTEEVTKLYDPIFDALGKAAVDGNFPGGA